MGDNLLYILVISENWAKRPQLSARMISFINVALLIIRKKSIITLRITEFIDFVHRPEL
jgi:hypothetical protein